MELGRVDVCCETSFLSSHMALPREGHLAEVLHIFAYHKSEMVYDPSDPQIGMAAVERRDCTTSEFGLELEEELPQHMPEPRGRGFVQRVLLTLIMWVTKCLESPGRNLFRI